MPYPNPYAIQVDMLANGSHYYSNEDTLREKHRLAGDQFLRWSLDRIPSWTQAHILDAGGGWGRYVWALLDNYGVEARDAILTDISEGMLKSALSEANQRQINIATAVNTLEALPFATNTFDIVMANKVLYHLGDIPRGIGELARVLKRNGTLLATTNSEKITATIIDLHYRALEHAGIPFKPEPPSSFSMENGADLLKRHFKQVDVHYYESETLIHEATTIRATYETIGRYRNLLTGTDITKRQKQALPEIVQTLAQEHIDRKGVLRSPELMGAFVCSEPR